VGIITYVQPLASTATLKFGMAQTSKIQCDLKKLLTLTLNISGSCLDIENSKQI